MEVFSYIVIVSILLTGIIPMVAGIIQTIKEQTTGSEKKKREMHQHGT